MSMLVLIFNNNLVRKSQCSEAQQTAFVHDLAQDPGLHFWKYHTPGLKVKSGTTEEECSIFPPNPEHPCTFQKNFPLDTKSPTTHLLTGSPHGAIANGLNRSTVSLRQSTPFGSSLTKQPHFKWATESRSTCLDNPHITHPNQNTQVGFKPKEGIAFSLTKMNVASFRGSVHTTRHCNLRPQTGKKKEIKFTAQTRAFSLTAPEKADTEL